MSRPTLALAAIALVLALGLVAQPASAEQPDAPAVVARNAIVIDVETGAVLFERAADQPVPPASLTKIFTAIAAAEITPLDRMMTASAGDLVGEASMGLSAGETDSFETLLHGMMLSSGNDAAMTIARNLSATNGDLSRATTDAFVSYANDRLAELGASSTQLVNPHGLDEESHVSTARDIAAVTRYGLAYVPAFRDALSAASYEGGGHSLYSTNQLATSYPGLIGGKTGITADAGYCLVEVAQRDGRTIIAVLLGSTAEAWYADARTLLDLGFATAMAPAPTAAEPSQAVVAADGLAVIGAGAERVVTSAAIASRKDRAPGVWPVMALVAIPCLLACGVLVGRIIEPTPRPAARQRPARRPARPSAGRAASPAGFTAPFATVAPRVSKPARRRPRRTGLPEPASMPSFGD